jgi:hypothetical protein
LGGGVGEGRQGEEGAAEGVDFAEVRLKEVEVASAFVKLLLSVFVGCIGDDLRSPIVCEAHIHTKGQAGHGCAWIGISFCLKRAVSSQAFGALQKPTTTRSYWL